MEKIHRADGFTLRRPRDMHKNDYIEAMQSARMTDISADISAHFLYRELGRMH